MKENMRDKINSELIRVLIDNTPVAYIILDDEYRIYYINDNFLKLRSLDSESTLGELCYNISNRGELCRQCAVKQALKTGEKAFVSRKDTLPDGMVRFIDDYAIPLLTDEETGRRFVLEIMVNRTPEMIAKERRDADYGEIISVFTNLLDSKDKYTATHSDSVRRIASMLARAMGLSAKEIFDISIAASLHDIGKVRIPDSIINKPGKLDENEFMLIKRHPLISYEMIAGLSSFEEISGIVRHHHERIDGRGYPDGLSGDEIPIGAKIVAVADTYDAIVSTRSYRSALSHEYALGEIRRVAGTQLDEEVVNVFLSMDFRKECVVSRELDGEKPPVERVIGPQSVVSKTKEIDTGAFSRIVKDRQLLTKIFENTPCGYVLMDRDRKVLFASRYFLDYMGLSADEVMDKQCYEAGGIGSLPCPGCAIERALESGKVEYMLQEQATRNGPKIFDLFGIPLKEPDGTVDYVIEAIIDRTAEVSFERQRGKDFSELIGMMTGLLEEQESGESMSAKITELRERLSGLLNNKPAGR